MERTRRKRSGIINAHRSAPLNITLGIMSTSMAEPTSLNSWADLAALIEKCSDGKWIFRGEHRVFATLQAKAGRVSAERGSARKQPYTQAHEREAMELSQKQARPHLRHTPSSETEWLAIAQHHGMSTRLLDWTESLLVAAYFATEQAGTKGDAVIFGVRGLRTINKSEEKKPFALTSPGIYKPPHITPRIPAQRSVFTIHPDPTSPFAPAALCAGSYPHRCVALSSVFWMPAQ